MSPLKLHHSDVFTVSKLLVLFVEINDNWFTEYQVLDNFKVATFNLK